MSVLPLTESLPMGITFERRDVIVDTGTSDRTGLLIFSSGALVAVLVRLDAEGHGPDRDRWFLEAGFGPCASPSVAVFDTPVQAEEWFRVRLACSS